jgi:predicted RecB family nuclease
MKISKSKFMAGVQCLKRLYLLVHEPQLAAQPDGADEAIIEQGREVGLLARQLFPGGVEANGSGGLGEAIRKTRELVMNPEVPAIFEAVFEHQDVIVKADILQRRKEDHWRLVEVKSTADLKEHHLEDLAIQSYILSHSDLKVASAWLAHINRNYVLSGTTVDLRQFFVFRNLTERVRNLQPALVLQLRSQFRVLAMPTAPDIPTGPQCTNPVVCEFYRHCNHPKPKDHIGCIPRLHASAIEQLQRMRIESIHDIPADFELSDFQRRRFPRWRFHHRQPEPYCRV